MTRAILALTLLAAACGGTSKPSPAPAPDPQQQQGTQTSCGEGTPTTAEECECRGLTVVGDIGDGQVACPEGMAEVSRIQYGIEGGVCCAAGAPAAP